MAGLDSISVSGVIDVLRSAREAEEKRLEAVSVHIYVDSYARRELVCAIRDALLPVQIGATLTIRALSSGFPQGGSGADVALIIAGGSDAYARTVATYYACSGIPVAIVADSVLDIPEIRLTGGPERLIASIASADETEVVRLLARWLVQATSKGTAFAANFPFCREARVKDLIKTSATQNAVAEAKDSIMGVEAPSMTSSQIRLALEVAAAYGKPFDLKRIPELAGVLGANAGFNAVQNSFVAQLPGIGWVINAGVGFAGTVATGKAVAARMESLDGNPTAITAIKDKAVDAIGSIPWRDLAVRALTRRPSDVVALSAPVPVVGGLS